MGITVIHASATAAGLKPEGTPPRPLSDPPCQFSGLEVELAGAGGNRSGLWQTEPGRFERAVPNAEVMHILTGACTFTPEGGQPLPIRAGDTLFFPAHTRGVWDVSETLRKVYVVMPAEGGGAP